MTTRRAQFSTRLGVIATTVGSAVGLGNVWRFPYEAGTHGGGAFMLCYIFFVLIIGVPVICAEFIMGREYRSGILGCYRGASGGRRWDIFGYAGVIGGIMILSFYSVVAGWTMEYCVEAATGQLTATAAGDLHDSFTGFITGGHSVLWTVIFLAVNAAVALGGVKKGIERISNILMPVLVVVILACCVNSLTLQGAREGLTFLFKPDFDQLTPSVILSAMGQAFFSLSIGLGCMMTYASYFRDDTFLIGSAVTIGALDTVIAILAGIIIFPAVFTFGMSPTQGPTLVFEVLPAIFGQLAGGGFWATLFFVLLFIGSLTSTISMSEIFISFIGDHTGLNRRRSTLLTTGIAMVLGVLCALSFGPLARLNLFNIFDYVSSNILLPVGGMAVSLFVGWRLDPAVFQRQMRSGRHIPAVVTRAILFCLRFVAPIGIAIILIAGLI